MKALMMYVLPLIALLYACSGTSSNNNNNTSSVENVYNDETLRQIYEYRCQENLAELVKYFSAKYPEYRKAAVTAVGTMKDSMAIVSLATLLNGEDNDLRADAAFALGQIGHPLAEKYLLESNFDLQPDNVKSALIIAMGKCGGQKSLEFIENLQAPHSNIVLISGQAKALCHLAKRGLYSVGTSQKAISFVCDTTIHEKARAAAAEYFGAAETDFSLYTDEFVAAYRSAKLIQNKINIILALGKCHNKRAFDLLISILTDNTIDYRVMMNAITAFENYPYNDCKKYILDLLKSNDEKISECAARFIFDCGTAEDANLYLDLSRDVSQWQSRTILLAAALKYSNKKTEIANSIKSGYNVAQNIYEKVSLLKALEPDLNSYDFVENNTFYSDNEMIRTEGLKILVKMYESEKFPEFSETTLRNSGNNMRDEFALIFKKAIQNGNSQMMAIAAQAIANHTEIAEYYMNTFFIKQALSNCVLPRDADTYIMLLKANHDINGDELTLPDSPITETPDWENICEIMPGANIVLKTTKGDITISTDVNRAPIAVSNFISLVKDGYFNNSQFTGISTTRIEHYGSLSAFDENKSEMIPSELTKGEFSEGTVALMTSALNNSCTTQWYIMLTPSVLAEGTSSIIGRITSGMEVVHTLNTGDEILEAHVK